MATPPQIDPSNITPSTGTVDDEDNSNDERGDENEPPVREIDDRTEALEEFEVDDEDEPNESGGTLRLDDETAGATAGATAGDEDWSDVEDDEEIGGGGIEDEDLDDDEDFDDDDDDDLDEDTDGGQDE